MNRINNSGWWFPMWVADRLSLSNVKENSGATSITAQKGK